MPRRHRFTTTLLSLSMAVGLTGWTTTQAVEPAKPAKPADSPSAEQIKKEWLLPTGEHWAKATETEKKAYILGILNLAMIEYQLSGPTPKYRTTVPKLINALEGMTVSQIVARLDSHYKANPDQRNRPIVQVIWSEIVAQKTDAAPEKSSKPAARKG